MDINNKTNNKENNKENNVVDKSALKAQQLAMLASANEANSMVEEVNEQPSDWRGYNVSGTITQVVQMKDGSFQARANYYDTETEEDEVGTIRIHSTKSKAQHMAMEGKTVIFKDIQGYHTKNEFSSDTVNYSASDWEILDEVKGGADGYWSENQYTTGILTRIKTVTEPKAKNGQKQKRDYVLLTMTYDNKETGVKNMLMKFKCYTDTQPGFSKIGETLIGAKLNFNQISKPFNDWVSSALPTMAD